MKYTLRWVKIVMVASVALLFTLTSFDNVTDPESNWYYVSHVLSMDTTFLHPQIMWRSITNPYIQKFAYFSIIFWEILTAVVSWIGCWKMYLMLKANDQEFKDAKKLGFIGLFLGFLLYMVGFIDIGGQWFNMWQSTQWNGQSSATIFLNIILIVMLFLNIEE